MSKPKDFAIGLLPFVVWIGLWQSASLIIKSNILLPSPLSVFYFLSNAVFEVSFYKSLLMSSFRISCGFFLSLFFAVLFAFISNRFNTFKKLLYPIILIMKSVPVVCFIIILLISLQPKKLSIVISFIMVFPIIYLNCLEGLNSCKQELFQMGKIFKIKPLKRLRYIILPQIFPFLKSACKIAIGVSWKSGIAAEVISLPSGSIGEMLYFARIYLNSSELLGWTVAILILSFLFEKIFLKLLDYLSYALRRG